MSLPDFVGFPHIARLNRDIVITEKIDGTNGQIYIEEDGVTMHVGSRTRWLDTSIKNYGFRAWADKYHDELLMLGPGHHFGEFWGSKIQRRYGLKDGDRHFSLFNVHLWGDSEIDLQTNVSNRMRPPCCDVVPVLYRGLFSEYAVQCALDHLRTYGSMAAPGFMEPEGIIIYHEAAKTLFKVTLEHDEVPKSLITAPTAQP